MRCGEKLAPLKADRGLLLVALGRRGGGGQRSPTLAIEISKACARALRGEGEGVLVGGGGGGNGSLTNCKRISFLPFVFLPHLPPPPPPHLPPSFDIFPLSLFLVLEPMKWCWRKNPEGSSLSGQLSFLLLLLLLHLLSPKRSPS